MRVGILLSHFGHNQLSRALVREASSYFAGGRNDADAVAFFQNLGDPAGTLPFPAMSVTEAFGFTGAAVATSADTARSLLRCPGPSRRYFYVWDLEWDWSRGGGNHRDFAAAYADPRLTLIARSPSHKALIEDCWNREVRGVVDDFDFVSLIDIIRGDTHG